MGSGSSSETEIPRPPHVRDERTEPDARNLKPRDVVEVVLEGLAADPVLRAALLNFIDHHCEVFTSDEESSHEHFEIHRAYISLYEQMLEAALARVHVSEAQLEAALLNQRAAGSVEAAVVAGMLEANGDFPSFKELMVARHYWRRRAAEAASQGPAELEALRAQGLEAVRAHLWGLPRVMAPDKRPQVFARELGCEQPVAMTAPPPKVRSPASHEASPSPPPPTYEELHALASEAGPSHVTDLRRMEPTPAGLRDPGEIPPRQARAEPIPPPPVVAQVPASSGGGGQHAAAGTTEAVPLVSAPEQAAQRFGWLAALPLSGDGVISFALRPPRSSTEAALGLPYHAPVSAAPTPRESAGHQQRRAGRSDAAATGSGDSLPHVHAAQAVVPSDAGNPASPGAPAVGTGPRATSHVPALSLQESRVDAMQFTPRQHSEAEVEFAAAARALSRLERSSSRYAQQVALQGPAAGSAPGAEPAGPSPTQEAVVDASTRAAELSARVNHVLQQSRKVHTIRGRDHAHAGARVSADMAAPPGISAPVGGDGDPDSSAGRDAGPGEQDSSESQSGLSTCSAAELDELLDELE